MSDVDSVLHTCKKYMHTYTYTHAYMYTYIYTHTHVHTYTKMLVKFEAESDFHFLGYHVDLIRLWTN